jgi:hypothetical protein
MQTYLIAKIEMLQGRCYLANGLLFEARKKLDKAMSSLDYNFPKHKFLIKLQSIFQYKLLKWRLIWNAEQKIVNTDEHTINYIELLANCLAYLFETFKVKIAP